MRKPPAPPRQKAVDRPIALTPEEIAFVRAMVIHEDAEIIALNKPPGLSSQGGRARPARRWRGRSS